MKKTFKKITALLASVAMIGSSIGLAAAAAYPAPFVSGGTANVAIVYGTGEGVSSLDLVEAANIQSDLQTYMGGTTESGSSVEGGDSVKIERSADKFNIANLATTVFVTSITEDDMPTLLADGTFTNRNNSEYNFEQSITLAGMNLTHFMDSDYKEKEPTVGFKLAGSAAVLNYTLDFTSDPLLNPDLETSDLTLMGKTYYILDVAANTNKTTLLDSANTAIVVDGEETTIDVDGTSYSVSISYIGSTEVKLIVNGETTNSLAEGSTQKLSDASYVGIKDIMYDSKTGTVSKVEVSIGSGKLELPHGSQIELNDDTIEEITSYITPSGANLDKIILEWKTDVESFVAPESELVMPGFEAIKLTMAEFNMPKEETITVDSGNDYIELKAPIKDGTVSVPLLYANASGEYTGFGKDSTNKLVTGIGTTLLFNVTNNDKYFVASWNSSTEAESYLLTAAVTTSDGANRTKITKYIDGDETAEVCKEKAASSTCTIGNLVLTINSVYRVNDNKWVNISVSSGGSFQRLYTAEGLEIFLPYTAANGSLTAAGSVNLGTSILTTGHNYDSFYLYMAEEDKDSNLGKGSDFYFTLDDETDGDVEVSTLTGASDGLEIGDTKDYESYVYSDLATKIVLDTDGNPDTAIVTYAGDQAYADVYVAAPSASVIGGSTGGTTSLGEVIVKDNESVSGKNLIVVGGSCINSVAAGLLGSGCGASFTEATGVGAGQFLIQSLAKDGKVALVVAGYDVTDTVKAATYLRTQKPDTAVGKKYIGTSSTSAELQVE